ncbi:shikimate kinase [Virgibacillus sp. DJP39]|uniref:shikimate kinase n=1 Tax=Virgibacillus sp. DJP39 TaxID=3409790 RepID=UPI003BB5FAF3
MNNIYLIGFMGSGKSSVGEKLSLLLGYNYVDTDQAVEEAYNKKIVDIFSDEGEQAFRTYESKMLQKVSVGESVISTGGGLIESEQNIKEMKNAGIIIYLEASYNTIYNRLKTDLSRPLWNQNREKQEALYEKRIQLYRTCADEKFLTDDKTIDAIATEIKYHIVNNSN